MTSQASDEWVLLPGTLCTPEVFAPLLDHLGVAEEKRHFIEVNAPHLQDYGAPLRAAATGGQIVCGFSLGAMILAHKLNALDRAKAVVLLACNPFPDPKGNRSNREAFRDRILAGEARDWVEENWALMSNDPSETLRSVVADMAENTSQFIAAQTELAISRPGAAEQLMATKLPLIFATGDRDQLTPPDPLRPIVPACQNATFDVLEGLGHFALLEAPDHVALAISRRLEAVVSQSNSET
ncbi:alpha/beta hydrolase [uncultured Tateyamaria sp.]|uniref:alpha/beta fold hydrolase n=1 Tax=uncultured Tateyamaria sp. TaxID=455651 RepID=UPI00260F02E7|nr:alpha/beta hydrolase [uncultured Tateyamaria sp.]